LRQHHQSRNYLVDVLRDTNGQRLIYGSLTAASDFNLEPAIAFQEWQQFIRQFLNEPI